MSHYVGDGCKPPHAKYTRLPDGTIQIMPCGSPWGIGVTTFTPEEAEAFGIDSVYGYGNREGNPHNFQPDEECCSAEEIAAWRKACDEWDAAEAPKEERGE